MGRVRIVLHGGLPMANKAELIEALGERLGDKKTASEAVDNLVDIIVRTVNKGEKVTITGFGVFEKRARAARTARNPRTGEAVKVKKTNVPAFRAGTQFKEVVGGTRKLPRATATKAGTTASRTAKTAGTASTRSTAKSTTSRGTAKTAATRTASTRSTAKAAPAKTSTSKASTSKASTAKASTAKAAPKKATTSKASTAKAS